MDTQEQIEKLLKITKANTVGLFVSKDGHVNILTRHSEDDIHGTFIFSGFATLEDALNEAIESKTEGLANHKLTKQWRKTT